MKEIKEDIGFDISDSQVLGVFDNMVHVKGIKYAEDEILDCILIIPREVYLIVWNTWLNGKREYCERYNDYCGVMGYINAEEFIKTTPITLNKWNKDSEKMIPFEHEAFIVTKFEERCDFEHG